MKSEFAPAARCLLTLLGGSVAGSALCTLAGLLMAGFQPVGFVVAVNGGWIVVGGVLGAIAGCIFRYAPWQRRQRVLFGFAMVLGLPLLGILGDMLVYKPLKFAYLTRRVESARTPTDEREAFLLARRWGRVWEVNLREPPQDWFDPKQLDAAVRDPKRTLSLELEWLESKPNGVPYRAYRTLTDKSNIYVLMRE